MAGASGPVGAAEALGRDLWTAAVPVDPHGRPVTIGGWLGDTPGGPANRP
jgi:hypothetical protein